ncbi:MAG: hypothetical protein PF549_04895 [Patescibacteria group bacterium]|nr:hypothetical protein [Patescibacteria group bacterium]
MSIIESRSVRYQVLTGEQRGRTCCVIEAFNGLIQVCFDDVVHREYVNIESGYLSALDLPGWESEPITRTYSLEEYLSAHKGSGGNRVREVSFVHSEVLRTGDKIATGEDVVENPRRGYNSSVLIHLDKSGWVELASRLPIALGGNDNWKFPAELVRGDDLVTDDFIKKDSVSERINWTRIFPEDTKDGIEVPSCVPLALEVR